MSLSPGGTEAVIRVTVNDDRKLIGEALAALIDGLEGFAACAVADPLGDPCSLSGPTPDLVLLVAAGGVGTLAGRLRALRAHSPGAGIVILADELDADLVSLVLEQRLSGLLLSDAAGSDLAVSLRQVAGGHAVLPAGWQHAMAGERPLAALSERQREVLRLLAEGLSYEEIGAQLFISANTVKFHVRSIFLRLGVRNRLAAARMYEQMRSGRGSGRGSETPQQRLVY